MSLNPPKKCPHHPHDPYYQCVACAPGPSAYWEGRSAGLAAQNWYEIKEWPVGRRPTDLAPEFILTWQAGFARGWQESGKPRENPGLGALLCTVGNPPIDPIIERAIRAAMVDRDLRRIDANFVGYYLTEPRSVAAIQDALAIFRERGGRNPSSPDVRDLAFGARVEMEHTRDPRVARRIAREHLAERPDYYARMRACGLAKANPRLSVGAKRRFGSHELTYRGTHSRRGVGRDDSVQVWTCECGGQRLLTADGGMEVSISSELAGQCRLEDPRWPGQRAAYANPSSSGDDWKPIGYGMYAVTLREAKRLAGGALPTGKVIVRDGGVPYLLARSGRRWVVSTAPHANPPSGDEELRALERAVQAGDVSALPRLLTAQRRVGRVKLVDQVLALLRQGRGRADIRRLKEQTGAMAFEVSHALDALHAEGLLDATGKPLVGPRRPNPAPSASGNPPAALRRYGPDAERWWEEASRAPSPRAGIRNKYSNPIADWKDATTGEPRAAEAGQFNLMSRSHEQRLAVKRLSPGFVEVRDAPGCRQNPWWEDPTQAARVDDVLLAYLRSRRGGLPRMSSIMRGTGLPDSAITAAWYRLQRAGVIDGRGRPQHRNPGWQNYYMIPTSLEQGASTCSVCGAVPVMFGVAQHETPSGQRTVKRTYCELHGRAWCKKRGVKYSNPVAGSAANPPSSAALKLPRSRVVGRISIEEAIRRKVPGIREAVARFRKFHGCDPSGDVTVYDDGRKDDVAGFLIGRSPEITYDDVPPGSNKEGNPWVHKTSKKTPSYLVHIPATKDTMVIGHMTVSDWLREKGENREH